MADLKQDTWAEYTKNARFVYDGIEFFDSSLLRGNKKLDETIYSKMSTDDIEVFGAFLGLTKDSYFGKMCIPCKFKNPCDWNYGSILSGERTHSLTYFLVEFTVYDKDCPSRRTNNRATRIFLYDIDDENHISYNCNSNGFARTAFWEKSICPTKDLTGKDLEVRLLFDNIAKVSREEKLLEQCKKNKNKK